MKSEKIQGKATINSVAIPESVKESNESNERLDVQLTFTYTEKTGVSKELNEMLAGIDESLLELAEKAGRSNTFTYLLDATRLGYKVDEDEEKALKELRKKLEDKELVFTTYRIKVQDLLKGTKYETDGKKQFDSVHTEARAYTSFNASYLLINDDEEGVFSTIQNRIIRGLENGKYTIGRTDD